MLFLNNNRLFAKCENDRQWEKMIKYVDSLDDSRNLYFDHGKIKFIRLKLWWCINIRVIWLSYQIPIHSSIFKDFQKIVVFRETENAVLPLPGQPKANFFSASPLGTNACNWLRLLHLVTSIHLEHRRQINAGAFGKDQNQNLPTGWHLTWHQSLRSGPTWWKDRYWLEDVLTRGNLWMVVSMKLVDWIYLIVDRLDVGAQRLGRKGWGQLNNFDLLQGRDALDRLCVWILVGGRTASFHLHIEIIMNDHSW